ncbi:DUF47 family protein [Nanchangia anserum]|uniref:DUF47 family protein n=1 Tax=Nanchangia anserum TaxID=2692125 RepID=A0A8I0GCF0_9ACTO|nr:DUF47 family protein [Nanchangia anserum]MBD3689441.1 DUF47 family protein [Nanchangia anserum]QOX81642.1 DUF47 family protein [Nanchangia anserum]
MILRRKGPKEDFYDLFTQAGNNLLEGTKLLAQTVSAPEPDRAEHRNALHDVEHRNDEITHTVARMLDQTFVTPMDRDDISLLASTLDDCLDLIDEVADIIVLYKIAEIPSRVTQQVEILQQCAELTAEAMPKLKTLKNLKSFTVEINRLENEGDKAYRKMLAELFETESDPIAVIKLKDIIESLEAAIDRFETLANTVETVYLKES